jgi:cell division protein FtsB
MFMSDSYYGEDNPRRQAGPWHFLNRVLGALIVFAVIALIICAFMPELRKQKEQAARMEVLRAEIEKQKAALNQRTREVDLLKNDPGYVEVLARERLDLMKEGETIFRLDTQPSPAQQKLKLHAQ